MWRRFRRSKVAIIGAIIVVLYYLVALFGDFIVPYRNDTRFIQYLYMPPQSIYFFNDGQFQPFVYEVEATMDQDFRDVYVPNLNKKIPLQFFAKGEPYKFLGLIDMDIHLFVAPGGVVS